MLINIIDEIYSCDDVETGIKRNTKLEYRMSYDDEKEMKAIVFVVGGFGVNSNISFLDFDREYLAKNFDVVVVDVFYHCFCARKSIDEAYNPVFMPNKEDLEELKKLAFDLNFECDLNEQNYMYNIDLLDKHVSSLKEQNKIEDSFKFTLKCDLIPPKGEYLNYGIMSAIDHINVLKDIMKKFPQFKTIPKIYGGGSYGGYMSLLLAKIAPWYVDGVVDNSGVCLPYLPHILGRLMQGEFAFFGKNYDLICFVKKYWNRDENSPFYFGDENYLIRTILNTNHLQIQASINVNTIFVSYHSMQDDGAPAQNKIDLYKCYENLGFDASLRLIKDENDVDGRFVKSLEHGLRMTDRALFRKELPLMLEKMQGKKFDMIENSITYPCKDKKFIFKDKGDKFELEIV